MENRPYTKNQIIVAVIIAISLIWYGASLTGKAFYKTKEQVNKNGIERIQGAINTLLKNGASLVKAMPECSDGWCDLDNRILLSYFINEENDPPTQLLPLDLKTNSGLFYQLKVTSDTSYIIKGISAKSGKLCWVASDDKTLANITKDSPTSCPQ